MTDLPTWIEKRIRVDDNGCWIWTGERAKNGYGHIRIVGIVVVSSLAHRAVYATLVGPIPEGLDLDHLCRVRCCVNPAHLEPVTRAENMRRSPILGMKTRTHCRHGHLRTPENTYLTRGGARQCTTCRLVKKRHYNDLRRKGDTACAHCGSTFKGERGLRIHTAVAHGAEAAA